MEILNSNHTPATACEDIPAGFQVTKRGVFYLEEDELPQWICSPLRVQALVRDNGSENWGRLLEWTDPDGHHHSWAMPSQLLQADGTEMRSELMRLGLEIAPSHKARQKLTEFIACSKPKARGRCVTRTGWHGDAFILPNLTIGGTSELTILQADAAIQTLTQSGSLDDWKSRVARFCVGNSRLLLAVSAAFAGMMLKFSGQESFGLNFVGASSSGKTTALRAASSVFGDKNYLQRWRATANGLEGLASQHNDMLLPLDELAQVDPCEAGEIAYMLANGTGKVRANRTGKTQLRATWQLIFLSAGEVGLSQHMLSAGKRTKAGQEVRLIEIPADAGAGFGMFEHLHDAAGGAELSNTINDAAAKFFGTPAIAFLEALSRDREEIQSRLNDETERFVKEHLPAHAGGQAHRVCQRFALVGIAGEYATAYGITGWNNDDAMKAAENCFSVWLDERGGAGNIEKGTILAQVKAFFEAHEESRFVNLERRSERPTINRAGFRRNTNTGTEYLVLPEAFNREICAGFEPKTVARTLIAAGWLRPASNGWQHALRIRPGKSIKVYILTDQIWQG